MRAGQGRQKGWMWHAGRKMTTSGPASQYHQSTVMFNTCEQQHFINIGIMWQYDLLTPQLLKLLELF